MISALPQWKQSRNDDRQGAPFVRCELGSAQRLQPVSDPSIASDGSAVVASSPTDRRTNRPKLRASRPPMPLPRKLRTSRS